MPPSNPRRLPCVRRGIAALLIGAFLPFTTAGCFGGFELTRKIYRFNQNVDRDKWIQWLTFLVLNIIPIYSFAILIDALFANSVQFWTGRNPILSEAGATRVVVGPHGESARATRRADGAIDLVLQETGGTSHYLRLLPLPEGLEARDADGRLLARVLEIDGMPRLVPAL